MRACLFTDCLRLVRRLLNRRGHSIRSHRIARGLNDTHLNDLVKATSLFASHTRSLVQYDRINKGL